VPGEKGRLVTLTGFATTELNVVVILLLALALGCLVVRLASGAGAQKEGNHEQKNEVSLHGMACFGFIREKCTMKPAISGYICTSAIKAGETSLKYNDNKPYD